MTRLATIDPATATGERKKLLDAVQQQIGKVPNLFRNIANSPKALQAYLGFGALDKGELSPQLREQIALAVAEESDCRYCLAAHTAIGKMLGLSTEALLDSRQGIGANRRDDAALRFAKAVVVKRGKVSDEDLDQLRAASYNDAEITEIFAQVVRNLFANYFNHLAKTEIDFPPVPELVDARS
jgi:uncharacterized peroxidase-related enzyme